jgi:hypothetical protein
MRSDAGAVLSLEVQSHPRSGQRVEQIRRYLHDVWGIGSERVQVGKAARFSNAEAADTIGCSSLSLLAPVATQWIERSYVIPQMGIEKSIVADRGLRSWEIEVHQGDRLLAHFGDHDNADGADIPNFDLAPDTTRHLGAATPEPLVATLSARDIEGAVVTAHDTLRLPDASEQSKNMVEREVLTFVFLPQSGSNTAATTDAMFAKLLSLLRPDAEISVRYPLDQSGQTPPEALTITERLVDELRHRTDLHPDLHLHPRASADPELPPYDRSVTIRVLQAK